VAVVLLELVRLVVVDEAAEVLDEVAVCVELVIIDAVDDVDVVEEELTVVEIEVTLPCPELVVVELRRLVLEELVEFMS
jgi:hypothetical protein